MRPNVSGLRVGLSFVVDENPKSVIFQSKTPSVSLVYKTCLSKVNQVYTIFRFEVSVDHSLRMDIFNAEHDLPKCFPEL